MSKIHFIFVKKKKKYKKYVASALFLLAYYNGCNIGEAITIPKRFFKNINPISNEPLCALFTLNCYLFEGEIGAKLDTKPQCLGGAIS